MGPRHEPGNAACPCLHCQAYGRALPPETIAEIDAAVRDTLPPEPVVNETPSVPTGDAMGIADGGCPRGHRVCACPRCPACGTWGDCACGDPGAGRSARELMNELRGEGWDTRPALRRSPPNDAVPSATLVRVHATPRVVDLRDVGGER